MNSQQSCSALGKSTLRLGSWKWIWKQTFKYFFALRLIVLDTWENGLISLLWRKCQPEGHWTFRASCSDHHSAWKLFLFNWRSKWLSCQGFKLRFLSGDKLISTCQKFFGFQFYTFFFVNLVSVSVSPRPSMNKANTKAVGSLFATWDFWVDQISYLGLSSKGWL